MQYIVKLNKFPALLICVNHCKLVYMVCSARLTLPDTVNGLKEGFSFLNLYSGGQCQRSHAETTTSEKHAYRENSATHRKKIKKDNQE